MSGVISLALTFWERIRRSPVATRFFYFISAGCVVFATFLAWHDEHGAVLAAEAQNKPQLRCSIDTTSVGSFQNDSGARTLLSMVATIRNTGADSSAEDYLVEVKTTDGRSAKSEPSPIPRQFPLIYPDGHSEVANPEDQLDRKTVKPIPRGGLVRGRLWFNLPQFSERLLSRPGATTFILYVRDIQGQLCSCVRASDASGPNTFRELPGIEPRFSK
jgi:hypothetical protein